MAKEQVKAKEEKEDLSGVNVFNMSEKRMYVELLDHGETKDDAIEVSDFEYDGAYRDFVPLLVGCTPRWFKLLSILAFTYALPRRPAYQGPTAGPLKPALSPPQRSRRR